MNIKEISLLSIAQISWEVLGLLLFMLSIILILLSAQETKGIKRFPKVNIWRKIFFSLFIGWFVIHTVLYFFNTVP